MIIIMGSVGSGKGTQSDLLAEKTGYTHVASGDLARNHATSEQRERMLKGEYLTDDEITALAEMPLSTLPDPNKIILDGIPRRPKQLDWLLEGVAQGRWKIEALFVLEADAATIWKRLQGRGRPDDTESAIEARIRFYNRETEPLLKLLEQKHFPIYHIDGNKTQAEVHQAIMKPVTELGLLAG